MIKFINNNKTKPYLKFQDLYKKALSANQNSIEAIAISSYDSNKKEILLSNAGHEPPLIFSKDGKFSNYTEAGPPLGIIGLKLFSKASGKSLKIFNISSEFLK